MSDQVGDPLAVTDMFPNGMHNYIKGGDLNRGRYLFRFDNGLGAMVYVHNPASYELYYINWDTPEVHDTAYRAFTHIGKNIVTATNIKELNTYLNGLCAETSKYEGVEPFLMTAPAEE
jgi:hypothetical protein